MNVIATQLDQALRAAGLPLIGVSVGAEDDKATWRVDLEPEATEDQRAQVDPLVAAFVPTPEVVKVDGPPALTAEQVLAWCATKLGVDPLAAALEVVSEITIKP